MKSTVFLLLCLCSFSGLAQDCTEAPELNQKIVQLAKGKIKKKVGRGECWDLAEYVLDETACDWDHQYTYGRLINPEKECIFPGDIVQFEKVKVRWKSGGATFTSSMQHHTAIIAEVLPNKQWRILHQNTSDHGRKVGESDFYPERVVSGKIMIYRPVRSMQ